jgi:methyl-accepting chemotaxis protein
MITIVFMMIWKHNWSLILPLILTLLFAVVASLWASRSLANALQHIIGGLTANAENVTAAATQITSSSQSLAEVSSEQAAAIEETSSSLEEMASMTKRNADNAEEANSLMSDTFRVVDQANHSMEELTQAMNEISVASDETAKINKTIDEIAFQTNLLALNAAVEAARAGEAGAGFAVVADEVRNLAMRAAESAKNTAILIEDTTNKVKGGANIVAKTNEDFGKVTENAKKVGALVGEITVASREQAQGIEQVNKAVSEMDRATQENVASAEELASASQSLIAQAEQMKEIASNLIGVAGNQEINSDMLRRKTIVLSDHRDSDYTQLQKTDEVPAIGTVKSVKRHKAVSLENIIPMDDKAAFGEF